MIEKEKNMGFFTKIADSIGFKKETSKNISQEKKEEIDPIALQKAAYSREIDELLNSGLLTLVTQIKENGYNLSKYQNDIFLQQLFKKLTSDDEFHISEAETILKNYSVSDSNLMYLILTHTLNGNKNIVNKVKEHFSERLNNEEFINKFFKLIFEKQDDKDNMFYSDNFYRPYNFHNNNRYFASKTLIANQNFTNSSGLSSIPSYYNHRLNKYEYFQGDHNYISHREYSITPEATIFINDLIDCKKEQFTINYQEVNKVLKLVTVDLFEEFSNHINLISYISITRYIDSFLDISVFLKNSLNFKGIDLTNEVKELKSFKDIIELQASKFFNNDKEKIVTKAQDMNIHMFLEKKVTNNIVTNVEKIQISSLPTEAKNIIAKIDINMSKCFSNIDKFDMQQKQQMEILKEKRLPEIIEKFLRMDEEYRTSLKDTNNKTPEDLMIDSLSNLNDVFQKNVVHLNMALFKDVSANNLYTKELTNKM